MMRLTMMKHLKHLFLLLQTNKILLLWSKNPSLLHLLKFHMQCLFQLHLSDAKIHPELVALKVLSMRMFYKS
jgi:hypothetical protein